MLRRLRGVLVTALVWGVGWSLVGLVLGGLMVVSIALAPFGVGMRPPELLWLLLDVVLGFGIMGLGAGALFAIALIVAERRAGSLANLSASRTAAWGALGGFAVSACFDLIGPGHLTILGSLQHGTLFGLVGAGLAAGSLTLARRARMPSEHHLREEHPG